MKSVRSKGKEKLAKYQQPMLATLGNKAFDNSDWIFEIKWDGYRAIAEIRDDDIQLYSRNGLSFKQLYPIIANELSKLKTPAVLDGEIVVFNENNKPDFQQLQQFGELKKGSLIYYVFDCLSIDGKSITTLPLTERKKKLKHLLPKSNIIRYADHVEENGIAFFNAAASNDLEGIIAKRSKSVYHPGKRTKDWLKIKHHNVQEAIIAGYTEPRNSRQYFGALILAITGQQHLKYIGHTGTGFSAKTLSDVYKKLQSLKIPNSPFSTKVPVNSKVTWVKPELVCNIKFTEITQGGILRHPVFMGLRIDKEAKEANRLELPDSGQKPPEKQVGRKDKVTKKRRTLSRT
jgi:bifunctional non-homologous end joining protein LigD